MFKSPLRLLLVYANRQYGEVDGRLMHPPMLFINSSLGIGVVATLIADALICNLLHVLGQRWDGSGS
jgi:hypothetical protein